MAYFRENETDFEYQRRFESGKDSLSKREAAYSEYDDGFDELTEETTEIVYSGDEVLNDRRKVRFRIAAGVGDFVAVIIGAACIFFLVTLIVNMIRFITSDITQNFSIFAIRF